MHLMNVFLVDAPTTMSVMALLVAYSTIALEMSLPSKITSFNCICSLQSLVHADSWSITILLWLDMDELENAAPGEEPVHRPLDRLLAVLVPVDGDHRGAVPGLAVPAAVRRRRGGEGRQVHAPRTSPAKRSSESEKERKRQKKKKGFFCFSSSPSSSLFFPLLRFFDQANQKLQEVSLFFFLHFFWGQI
ncbi:Os02g0218500 [Oryza sativa Japonica Group]|uniref:Os02g0218500 protein n=2 Tax=Oryza sativa subsp. japonica TaxID=39947 RepID=Q0E2R9_ORYSJ|nr:hypothetical protein EE612_009798 [Oryza sativa]BAF08219.1 Os02g0218500 [Oryza sativa Japonica Group]BAS77675.1 Os02g0218500 [Oryza sativa Japonica Group]|eukprot:NP_001046305.1 Os02g0218500 [Oryza sativa Japonica Group]